jgi:hypothetical protein
LLSPRTSAHFPKFVLHLGHHLSRTSSWATSKLMILVPLLYLKFLNRIRRLQVTGNSNRRH